MTQVPPRRYSSASATRAPCCAAMRAARTPPEPPPMTKRSKSKSDISDVMPALFHLGAHLRHDVHREIVCPSVGLLETVVDHLRLFDNHLLTDGRLIKDEDLLQLGLGEFRRIETSRQIDQLGGASVELLVQLDGDLVDVLLKHEIGLHDDALDLLDHAARDRVHHVVHPFELDNLLGDQDRA